MKNKLVKISLLLMSLLLVFCFFGCDSEDADTSEDKEYVYVEFETGRGKFTDEDFKGKLKVEKGTAIKDYPEATRNGYNLEGWYFDEDYEEKCEKSYKFDEDTLLFAKWEEKVTYTVKFDISRANYGTAAIPDVVVEYGAKISKPETDPERGGCYFFGWCVNGDESKVWNFATDTVKDNIKLVAVFKTEDSGNTSTCEHNWETTEYVQPTCEQHGRITQKCSICRAVQRITKDDDPSLKRLEHLELEERVEPSCAVDGYLTIYCPNGCGLTKTTTLNATGAHEYDDFGWKTVVQPTKYVSGKYENPCIVCNGAALTEAAPYNAQDSDLYDERVNISYLYTGGSYVNEKFVNVATLGKILVSSFFDGTHGYNANDGDDNTFWNADTYVDGADYTADWIELELSREFDVGAVRFVLPNYYAWELGEDCYVSYDVEYWDVATESWVSIGMVSDKNAKSIGINCELMIELDSPVTTNKIRAKVTHATRYAPAVIYEMEVYAKTEGTERLPVAIPTQATASVSGKYNEWVNGAGALTDNTTGTYWTTDARYNPSPWAVLDFPVDTYVACVQMAVGAKQNRTFKLEVLKDGEWVQVGGKLTVPASGELGENVVSNSDGICTFNVDIEDFVSSIKVTITYEPEYWTSYVYDITPYSVVEQATNEAPAFGCSHRNPLVGDTVAPTCDSTGYTNMNCVCGAVIRTKATDALGHDFGKYTIETPATATSFGKKVSTCRNEGCGATSTISYEENFDSSVITTYLHNAPAAWAQTLDDGNYTEAYTWGNKYFARYGARATVMMSITYTDALVPLWQEHFEVGVFDLGSHSYNHTSIYAGTASSSSLIPEVINAQYWFKHNYRGQYILGFAAPLGATSESVAEFLTGPLAANRNGGDTGIFYNTIDQLTSRKVWGDLNSYISKADQTEGDYVFVNVKKPSGAYIKGTSTEVTVYNCGSVSYILDESYKNMNLNYVFDEGQMTFVDKGYNAGTYVFSEEDYRYDFYETGSYNLVGNEFVFVNDNSGEYRLVKATIGSYEKGVEKLVQVGGFTVECLHTIAQSSGVIYTKYEPTISKLEHLTRFGVWMPSYNDLIQYFKEYQHAKLETVERTDSSITISLTDDLDDYMFNHAVTVKVDIPDSWTTVTVKQGDKEIPLVSYENYTKSINMSTVSCAIDDGYLYVDVVPDCGNVVITVGEKNTGVNDYKDRVVVSFEPGEGILKSAEYETVIVKGNEKAMISLAGSQMLNAQWQLMKMLHTLKTQLFMQAGRRFQNAQTVHMSTRGALGYLLQVARAVPVRIVA